MNDLVVLAGSMTLFTVFWYVVWRVMYRDMYNRMHNEKQSAETAGNSDKEKEEVCYFVDVTVPHGGAWTLKNIDFVTHVETLPCGALSVTQTDGTVHLFAAGQWLKCRQERSYEEDVGCQP